MRGFGRTKRTTETRPLHKFRGREYSRSGEVAQFPTSSSIRMHDSDARTKAPARLLALEEKLRSHALAYPETVEEFPWGHSAIKVKGKSFVFVGLEEDEVSISVKLTDSRELASDLPFTEPTHYGLGKHGWVTAHLRPKEKPPVDLILEWIGESYRAIAPKRLVKRLDES